MPKKTQFQVSKRPKIECEICGEKDTKVLDRHHIQERHEGGINDDFNLAIICASCHRKTHSGSIEILGVLHGTKPPTGRILVYKIDGKCNVPGIDKDYFKKVKPKPKEMKLFLKD